MIHYISDNWQLITFVATCMIYLGRQVMAARKGIRALLRADLILLYNKYHDDLGYCPIYVKQSLEEEYKEQECRKKKKRVKGEHRLSFLSTERRNHGKSNF